MYPQQEAVVQGGAVSWHAWMVLGRGQLTLQPSPVLNGEEGAAGFPGSSRGGGPGGFRSAN